MKEAIEALLEQALELQSPINVRVRVREALTLLRAGQVEGHGEACFYCGEPCSNLAGDPGQWPLIFAQADETGIARAHHVECVVSRLPQEETET